jgi:hypothetical protein
MPFYEDDRLSIHASGERRCLLVCCNEIERDSELQMLVPIRHPPSYRSPQFYHNAELKIRKARRH